MEPLARSGASPLEDCKLLRGRASRCLGPGVPRPANGQGLGGLNSCPLCHDQRPSPRGSEVNDEVEAQKLGGSKLCTSIVYRFLRWRF